MVTINLTRNPNSNTSNTAYSTGKVCKKAQHQSDPTHRDMLVVLPRVIGSCHDRFLCDPLQEVINLAVQSIKFEDLLQLSTALPCQVLQPCVQLVHLRLPHCNRITGDKRTSHGHSVLYCTLEQLPKGIKLKWQYLSKHPSIKLVWQYP